MIKPVVLYHPWELIWEELESRNWTQSYFAELIWVPRTFVNDLIRWRKNVTPVLAILIGAAFGTSAEMWMNMQKAYDVLKLEKDKEIQAKVKKIKSKVLEIA